MSSGRKTTLWILPLLLLLAACDNPVGVEIVEEEPEEVETCEWLIPIGIELVNDYFYTLEETDLAATLGDPDQLPTSIIALNARGAELDRRAEELDCDLAELNMAIAVATEGLESADPVVNVFLDTVRGGVLTLEPPYGDWLLVAGAGVGSGLEPLPDRPITLQIDEEAAQGESGCNGYYLPLIIEQAAWQYDESRPATSTELMCLDDAGEPFTELMNLETRYLRLLREVTDYMVSGDELTLSGPDVELRYERGRTP
jgi:heat shock protein HslJ